MKLPEAPLKRNFLHTAWADKSAARQQSWGVFWRRRIKAFETLIVRKKFDGKQHDPSFAE